VTKREILIDGGRGVCLARGRRDLLRVKRLRSTRRRSDAGVGLQQKKLSEGHDAEEGEKKGELEIEYKKKTGQYKQTEAQTNNRKPKISKTKNVRQLCSRGRGTRGPGRSKKQKRERRPGGGERGGWPGGVRGAPAEEDM